MQKPLVSVIIPTYNREKYIIKTLKSVLEQTYKNIEIIIIDDGSEDNTKSLIDKFIDYNNIKNVCYYYKNNGGVSSARNTGVQLSKGSFIAFLDSDDLWNKTKLKKQIDKMIQTKAPICYCGTEFMDKDKSYKIINSFKEGSILYEVLKAKADAQTITWLIDKSFITENNILFYEGCSYSEDLEFFLKCITKGKCCCVKEYLAYYINHDNSLSHNYINQFQEIEMWERYENFMNSSTCSYDKNKIKALISEYRLPSRLIKTLYDMSKENSLEFSNYYDKYKKYINKINPFIGKYKLHLIIYKLLIDIRYMKKGVLKL